MFTGLWSLVIFSRDRTSGPVGSSLPVYIYFVSFKHIKVFKHEPCFVVRPPNSSQVVSTGHGCSDVTRWTVFVHKLSLHLVSRATHYSRKGITHIRVKPYNAEIFFV